MYEWSGSEFDAMMMGYRKFRRVEQDPLVSNGSMILGVDQLQYTDGRTTVTFIGSSGSMQLRITRKTNKGEDVLIDSQYKDFGLVRETVQEHLE